MDVERASSSRLTSWIGRCSFWYVCKISRNCLYVSGSDANLFLILLT